MTTPTPGTTEATGTTAVPVVAEARLLEVHRLAVAGQVPGIARSVGDRVCRGWLARARFADVIQVAELTLTLGPDPGALYQLGWARRSTGSPREALTAYQNGLHGDTATAFQHYQASLPSVRQVYDRAGEPVTRYNLPTLCRDTGQLDSAVTELEQFVEVNRHSNHPDLTADTADTAKRLRTEPGRHNPGQTLP